MATWGVAADKGRGGRGDANCESSASSPKRAGDMGIARDEEEG